jgi:hypothetical protein
MAHHGGPEAETRKDRTMSDDSEERLRSLRNEIGDMIEILQSVRKQTQGFALKQAKAEKASLETHSKFDHLKAGLAKKISKLVRTEDGVAAHGREHHELYFNWLAINKKIALLGYFRWLRESSCVERAQG